MECIKVYCERNICSTVPLESKLRGLARYSENKETYGIHQTRACCHARRGLRGLKEIVSCGSFGKEGEVSDDGELFLQELAKSFHAHVAGE